MSVDFEYFDKKGVRWCRWTYGETVFEMPYSNMHKIANNGKLLHKLVKCSCPEIVESISFWASMIRNPD